MILLDNAMIKSKYDCIVIGAGIGGITAAALLAKKGLDVLLIEQHYVPGGACSSIKRRGQYFDTGAALLFGFHEEVVAPHRFVMNVLEEPINVIQHDSIYRCNFDKDGKRQSIIFWENFEKFFKELTTAFPEHAQNLKGFYNYLDQLYQTLATVYSIVPISEMSKIELMGSVFKNPKRMMNMLSLMNRDMKTVMTQFFGDDKRIQTFYDMLLSLMLTTRVGETPIILAAAIFIVQYHGGACYPQGSPQMLPNAIEKAFERLGGTVLYRHLVDQILIDDKRKAYGVRLKNGTEILSDAVVSDASIWQNYNKLLPRRVLSQKRIDWANSFKPTLSALVLYLAVDAEVIPPEVRSIEMFIEDINNYLGGVAVVYVPSMEDPSLAPPGMHSLTVIAELMETFPRPGDPAYQSPEYYKLKEKETNRVLNDIEKYIPNLRKHIRCIEVGTPGTIERFTLKDWGCIGGPKQSIGQHMLKRPGAKSEFKHLFFVGDSTTMGESVMSTTTSAVGGANMVLKQFGKKIYGNQTFDKEYVHFVKGVPRAPLPPRGAQLDEMGAKRVAMECQWCLDPKCNKECPAHVDVPGFTRRMESLNFTGAARCIREMNPLGEVCGLICPAEKLCEKNCNRKEFSPEVTRVSELQAWVCKHAGAAGWDKSATPLNGKRVAIVGSGPAGLSCAHYLARMGYQVDVFEKNSKKGGMLTQVIPSFRLPDDAIERDIAGLSVAGINFHYSKILGKDVTVKQLAQDYAAVFIAPGLWTGRRLSLPGIENAHVIDALAFIRQFKEAGTVDTKGRVLVIGGGSVATDAAFVAKRAGASKVALACLECEAEMPCLPSEREELKREGVEIFDSLGPKAFLSSNKIRFIQCTKVNDDKGNFCLEFDESKTKELEFDLIIMAVGQALDSDLASYLQVEFGTTKIKVDPETQLVSGWPNAYAGGDLVRGAGTVVQAVADGRRAARAIHQSVSKK